MGPLYSPHWLRCTQTETSPQLHTIYTGTEGVSTRSSVQHIKTGIGGKVKTGSKEIHKNTKICFSHKVSSLSHLLKLLQHLVLYNL